MFGFCYFLLIWSGCEGANEAARWENEDEYEVGK